MPKVDGGAAAAQVKALHGDDEGREAKHKKAKKDKKGKRPREDDGCDDLGDLGAFADKVRATESACGVTCRPTRLQLAHRRALVFCFPQPAMR